MIRDGFQDVVGSLLRDIYLVDDLRTALNQARSYPYLAFVTPGGEMACGGGVINGGATDVAQLGLVHKKREIKELGQAVVSIEAAFQGKELERQRAKSEIAGVEEDLRIIRQQLHTTELQLVNAEKDLQQSFDECRRIEERLTIKEMENEQLREEKDAILLEMEHSRQKGLAGAERKGGFEAETARLEEALGAGKQKIEEARNVVTEMKVRAAALREKRESILRTARRVEDLVRDLRARRAGHGDALEKSSRERQRLATEIEENESLLRQLLVRQIETEASFVAIKEMYDGDALTVQEDDAALKGIRICAEEIRQSAAAKNLRNSELVMLLQNIEISLMDKYRVSISSLPGENRGCDPDEPGLLMRRAELQKIIDEMGDVNLTAIEEYQELEERFMFLSGQKGDLEESLHSLQKAIQRINKTTRKRFLETFHLVNTKFQEVFPRLFCGGRAELRLTNEEDLLETGIDIIVQPPGKKLQNVSLLSGGEKALTAVALVFSIFLVKPSPFCLLDEVDAPLDDAKHRQIQ